MLPPSVRAAGDEIPSSVVPGPCTPGTWVPCHYYYRDLEGHLQCPMGLALCKPDGTSTYECNAWIDTPEGPRPREGSSALDLRDE